jgi:hypothetical protein
VCPGPVRSILAKVFVAKGYGSKIFLTGGEKHFATLG